MAIDFGDAMRSGMVSARAAKKHGVGKQAVLPGVKGPKPVGSQRMGVRKDEATNSNRGAVPARNLNSSREYQKSGHVSKGGSVNASNTPGVKHIESYPNKKPFPAGAKISGSGSQKSINPKSKGRIPPSGGYYGGGGQNTQ